MRVKKVAELRDGLLKKGVEEKVIRELQDIFSGLDLRDDRAKRDFEAEIEDRVYDNFGSDEAMEEFFEAIFS